MGAITMKTILLLAVLTLGACGDNNPMAYWHKDPSKAHAITSVEYVAYPCPQMQRPPGETLYGCSNYVTGRIEVLATLSDADKVCTVAHETTHLLGYDHDPKWIFGRPNCGIT